MVNDSCPKQEDNGDDRLSNLPEHILLTIIDRLDIREAARTSVLSGRWRHLPAMLSRLVINVWDFLDPFNCNNDEIVRGSKAVVKVTKSILGRRDLSRNTIQFLCMTFILREDDPISIGHAVAHAMATQKIWVQPECLTERLAYVFHQLRFVNLSNMPEGYDLTWTLFILKAAPNLKELYMSVWDHLCEMKTDAKERKSLSYSENKGAEWESSAIAFQHQSLVTLAIFGFRARDYMMNYVRRVMETAVNLKAVFLYDRLTCDKCRSILSRFPPKWKQDCVEKFITNGIKSSAIMQFQTIAI
uniref:F-box domain-containing protein n=1 Tax=Aegilops tauschii subsp. strangulata TaxID=200361 RepID=A0A453NEI0_AEGTS